MGDVWWHRRARSLPEGWEDVADRAVGHWADLDAAERERLGDLMEGLVRWKRWEAARGFELTGEMQVVIAAEACLLVLGLDLDWYREVSAIIVHPSTVTLRGERPGPVRGVMTDAPLPILGEARDRRGPVVVAWDAALADARDPTTGRNVVLHEFAHKLDMLDGLLDGTPPLAGATRQRWVDVCTAAYQALREGRDDGALRPYAGRNPAEFFAVATETFFDLPSTMRERQPDLYDVLAAYYRQDPAARAAR